MNRPLLLAALAATLVPLAPAAVAADPICVETACVTTASSEYGSGSCMAESQSYGAQNSVLVTALVAGKDVRVFFRHSCYSWTMGDFATQGATIFASATARDEGTYDGPYVAGSYYGNAWEGGSACGAYVYTRDLPTPGLTQLPCAGRPPGAPPLLP